MMQPTEAPVFVSARDLHVEFKMRRRTDETVRAVDGVDIDIRRGETLCIVGESGSGKTTLVRAIGHLVPIASGAVMFDDVNVADLKKSEIRSLRRRVQYVFQDPFESFNRRETIFSIVSEPLRVHKLTASAAELEDRVYEALEECGLKPAREFARLYPHQLSGGQRQRVAIAAAIVLRPELLIADEPVSMLDVSIRSDILSLFVSLKESHDMTLVFVTHDLAVAWEVADRIAVMYLGKIVEQGSADQLIGAAANPYTHALVTAIPIPDPNVETLEPAVTGDISDVKGIPPGCRFHPRCPYAIDACGTVLPALVSVGDDHWSACIRNDELSLEPPHKLATEA